MKCFCSLNNRTVRSFWLSKCEWTARQELECVRDILAVVRVCSEELECTCGTQRHKGLSMLPEHRLALCPNRKLTQEVVNEVQGSHRSQVPLQLVQHQQLHLLRGQKAGRKKTGSSVSNAQMKGATDMLLFRRTLITLSGRTSVMTHNFVTVCWPRRTRTLTSATGKSQHTIKKINPLEHTLLDQKIQSKRFSCKNSIRKKGLWRLLMELL